MLAMDFLFWYALACSVVTVPLQMSEAWTAYVCRSGGFPQPAMMPKQSEVLETSQAFQYFSGSQKKKRKGFLSFKQ